jgi:glyoxylase-like metal-dependent hydrolase (beta-lactamase superfamily II)
LNLAPGLYLVGGGVIGGFGISRAADAHVYALVSDGELALIDCGIGTPESLDATVATIRADGLDPAAMRTIFVTHAHADHAGGAAAYRERFSARVVASTPVADILEAADEERSSLRAAQKIGIVPADFRMTACPVERRVDDGDVVAVGTLSVRAIATPGHAAGHTSWLVETAAGRLLFTGDALFALGRVLLQAVPDCDLAATASSIRTLAALEFDALLPGHGAIVLQGGPDHVAMAVADLDGLRLPRNLA